MRVGDVVMVICKPPVPGLVKTRMCPPLSPDQAAALARAALTDTFVACDALAADRRVAVVDGPSAAGDLPDEWIPSGWEIVPQASGGLDVRLAAAFDDVLRTGDRGVLVAMDTPQATPDQIQLALLALEAHDAVIGMTDDGGYWIVGLNAARSDAFLGVPMSTGTTGAAQLERLQSLGLRVATVDQLCDLDTVADVSAIATNHPHLLVSQWFLNLELDLV